MKNIILGIIIGLLIVLSINSTTLQSNNRPAQPKSWITYDGDRNQINNTIIKYQKQGYIIHQLEFNGNYDGLLIMYKYY